MLLFIMAKFHDIARRLWGLKQAGDAQTCAVDGCLKPKARKKTGAVGCAFCHMHRMRIKRWANPIGYQYNRLKDAARRRCIPFLLTKEEWQSWCATTGYATERDKPRAELPSVDRKRDDGPYSIDNIQLLTVGENARKENNRRRTKAVVRGRIIAAVEYREPQPADPLDSL